MKKESASINNPLTTNNLDAELASLRREMFKFARLQLRDEATAEDAVQEAWWQHCHAKSNSTIGPISKLGYSLSSKTRSLISSASVFVHPVVPKPLRIFRRIPTMICLTRTVTGRRMHVLQAGAIRKAVFPANNFGRYSKFAWPAFRKTQRVFSWCARCSVSRLKKYVRNWRSVRLTVG